MSDRAKSRQLSNLSYEEGNLLSLKTHKARHFDFILDKGTVDAIASGGATQSESQVSPSHFILSLFFPLPP